MGHIGDGFYESVTQPTMSKQD